MSEKLHIIPEEHIRQLGIQNRAKERAARTMHEDGVPERDSAERRRREKSHAQKELSYELLWGEANGAFRSELFAKCGIPSNVDTFEPPRELIDAYRSREERIRMIQGITETITNEEAIAGIRAAYKTQRETLDEWFSYFSESDHYSNWFKIYALSTITRYTSFDTGAGEGKFKERKDGYIFADFPRLNARIVGEIHDILKLPERRAHESNGDYDERLRYHHTRVENFNFIEELQRKTQQYGQLNLELVKELALDPRPKVFKETQRLPIAFSALGRLPVVNRMYNDSAQELVDYLADAGNPPAEPFPVEWCIAALGSASTYLQTGDVHIYSSTKNGTYYPRLAVAFDTNGRVREVRGIERRQDIEEGIVGDVKNIVAKLNGGEEYLRRIENVYRLNQLQAKMKRKVELSNADVVFLYRGSELGTLQGLGYGHEHPLAEVLRDERRRQGKYEQDILIALNCLGSQLAQNESELRASTTVYVGPLFPGIFTKIRPHVRIYSRYPSQQIKRVMVTTNVDASFAGSPPPFINVVVLSLADLGLEKASTKEIYEKARRFGLGYPPPITRILDELNSDLHHAVWGVEQASLFYRFKARKVTHAGPDMMFLGGSLKLVFRVL